MRCGLWSLWCSRFISRHSGLSRHTGFLSYKMDNEASIKVECNQKNIEYECYAFGPLLTHQNSHYAMAKWWATGSIENDAAPFMLEVHLRWSHVIHEGQTYKWQLKDINASSRTQLSVLTNVDFLQTFVRGDFNRNVPNRYSYVTNHSFTGVNNRLAILWLIMLWYVERIISKLVLHRVPVPPAVGINVPGIICNGLPWSSVGLHTAHLHWQSALL